MGTAFPRKGSSHLLCECVLSHVRLFATPRIVAYQAPLWMEFSRQEYWSGLPFPSPEERPNPGIRPASLASPALAGGFLPLHHLTPPLTMFFTQSEHLCSRAARGTQRDGVPTGKPRGPVAQDACWGPLAFKSQS